MTASAPHLREDLLTPRFYKTDYAAMDKLDMSSIRAEWDAMLTEYEGDNNHDHFQRDAAFADEVRTLMPQLSPELRQEFLDFLISSCTSEFSGCILYNEIDLLEIRLAELWDQVDHFVVVDVRDCLFQRHDARRGQADGVILAGRTEVRQLL